MTTYQINHCRWLCRFLQKVTLFSLQGNAFTTPTPDGSEISVSSFDHLMQRADSLKKTLMLGKIEGKKEKGATDDEMAGWMVSPTRRTCSVQFSHLVVSESLRPHEPQHARPPCPSPTPRVHPNPCPTAGGSGRQTSLACCRPQGHKESETS